MLRFVNWYLQGSDATKHGSGQSLIVFEEVDGMVALDPSITRPLLKLISSSRVLLLLLGACFEMNCGSLLKANVAHWLSTQRRDFTGECKQALSFISVFTILCSWA